MNAMERVIARDEIRQLAFRYALATDAPRSLPSVAVISQSSQLPLTKPAADVICEVVASIS